VKADELFSFCFCIFASPFEAVEKYKDLSTIRLGDDADADMEAVAGGSRGSRLDDEEPISEMQLEKGNVFNIKIHP
jgi:hypothetical protein